MRSQVIIIIPMVNNMHTYLITADKSIDKQSVVVTRKGQFMSELIKKVDTLLNELNESNQCAIGQ